MGYDGNKETTENIKFVLKYLREKPKYNEEIS